MNLISFPILNLTIHLNQVAFRVGTVPIYWYAVLIVASFILAFFLCKKKEGTFGIYFDEIVDLSIWLIPICFICARLYYIVFNLESYPSLASMLNFKDGGLAIYGGILGGIVTIYIFCKKRKKSILDLLDYLAPYLALGQAIGRWGNFINVEAYGMHTNVPWKMGIQTRGGWEYVHPTFLYESIVTFLLFIGLTKRTKNRQFSGEITGWYLVIYSFARGIIEGLRVDSLMLGNFRISQVVSFAIFIISSLFLILQYQKRRNKSISPEK